VHNKLSIGFERLGEQNLKNVAHPVMGYRVLQGGAPSQLQAPQPEPMRVSPAVPKGAGSGLSPAWDWYTRLPRASVVLIAITVFLFAINVFSGLHELWFQWPAAVLLLIAFLRATRGRGP
jgi:adenylate cyclase